MLFLPELQVIGGEIVKLSERGSAFYAPGSAAAVMAESVLNNRRRLLPASCLMKGQYGLDDVYIGVPCISRIKMVLRKSLNWN